MIKTIIGIAVGFSCGYILKNITSNKKSQNELGESYKSLYNSTKSEVDTLTNRLKNYKEENESLTMELQQLKNKLRNQENTNDDQIDRIDELHRKINILKKEKSLLEEKNQEYKDLLEATQK